MDQTQSKTTAAAEEQDVLQKRDDAQFQAEARRLIEDAENIRLKYAKQRRDRGFIAMNAGILVLLAGAGGFGWFLLAKYDILMAVLSIVGAVILPILLNIWASQPINAYKKAYKSYYMPKIAKALGNFKFFHARGISPKIISKTGIIPSFDSYDAEDCFMGTYKGIRVILSEARLNKKKQSIFKGVFVLLELPEKIFNGHTILSANQNMVKAWASTRWKKLQHVDISTDNADWNIFQIFSDKPNDARLMIGERLLKELSEAAAIFHDSLMSVVLFRKKYVFMMIPYDEDMFEASNMHVPVTTNKHAMECKKEIDQIIEIIDVFEVYRSNLEANRRTQEETARVT